MTQKLTVRRYITNSVLATCSILAAFIALEISLALFYPQKVVAKPFFHIQSFFCEYHPVFGWRNKPDYSGIVRVDPKKTFRVTHNANGQRGTMYPYERKTGTQRIMILGDSFAWGFGVEDHEVFSSLIERNNPAVEVLNMGVSGYGTDQEFLTYTEEGHKYKPDLLVIAFYANDYREIASSISYGYPKPCATTDDNILTFWNVPVPRNEETERKMYGNPASMYGRAKKFLRRNTHSYPFLAARINSIDWMRRMLLMAGIGEEYEHKISNMSMMQYQDERKINALLERLLADLAKESAKNGTKMLLLNIPIKENPANRKFAYTATLPDAVPQNDDISRMLQEISTKNNINFIDLLPAVRKEHANGIPCYNDNSFDIHFNQFGHKLLASTITDWAVSSKKAPSPQ